MKKNNYPTIFIVLLFSFFSFLASADVATNTRSINKLDKHSYNLSFGAGNYCEQIGKVQVNEKGSKNICTFRPYLSLDLFFKNSWNFHYGILSGTSLPQSPKDELTHRMTMHFMPAMRIYYEDFYFQSALGIQTTRIWGDGGEVTLNNGNTTQSFNAPNKSVLANNYALSIGVGYSLFEDFSLSSDLFTLDLFDADKRNYSLLILGKYHFGELFSEKKN